MGEIQQDLVLKKYFKAFLECAVKFKMAGLREMAKVLASSINNQGSIWDKLKEIDYTETEVKPYNDEYNLVIVKNCPFLYLKQAITEWSDEAKKITENYNRFPEAGGGAFDPICIIHRLTRQEIAGKNIIQLGCASKDDIILSDKEINKLGIEKSKAEELLKGNACLYALKK